MEMKKLNIDVDFVKNIDIENKEDIYIFSYDFVLNNLMKIKTGKMKYPNKYIFYQVEKIYKNWKKWDYLKNIILNAEEVWDISNSNIIFLKNTLKKLKKIRYIPYFYSKFHMIYAIPKKKLQDNIDVLLYGSSSPLRDEIIIKLNKMNLNFKFLWYVDDYTRNMYINKSKIVLSIQKGNFFTINKEISYEYHNPKISDPIRIIPLICKKKFVLFDKSIDEDFNEVFSQFNMVHEIDDIPKMCEYYIQNNKEREYLVNKAHKYIKEHWTLQKFLYSN